MVTKVSTNGLVAITKKTGSIHCWTIDDEKIAEVIRVVRAVLGEPLIVTKGDEEEE